MKRRTAFVLIATVVVLVAALAGTAEGGCKCHEPPPKQYDRAGREIVFQPNGKRIPGGDYRHTCGGCVADHEARVLRCAECMDDAHDLVVPAPVSLDLCVRYHNRNGVLECMPGEEYHGSGTDAADAAATQAEEERRRRKRERLQRTMEEELMPAGSFRDTCDDCRVVAEAGVDVGQTELAKQDVLFDPQTAGGLLIACDPEDADALFEALKPAVPSAQRVGTVQPYAGSARIYLK